MHPVILQFGSFKLPAYGLMVALGYAAGILYLFRRSSSLGFSRETLSDLVFYSVVAGMIGAKLFYAFTYWDSFGGGFGERALYALRTFQYGFVFYGGLIFGAAAFWGFARFRKLDALAAADLFAPALALGHAFGRVGCFLAGCCHGRPSGNFLAVVFTDPRCEVAPQLLGVPLYPVQLMEAAGNLVIFAVLDAVLRRRHGRGAVLAAYAALYSLQRFLLEFLRGDDRGALHLGVSPAQWISAAVMLLAAAAMWSIRTDHEKK